MDDINSAPHDENPIVVDVIHTQLQHFRNTDPPCRALELPEGVLLRYNLAESVYFYLRTTVRDGKIATRVFASDSPYERTKTLIGEVLTPMFEAKADRAHLDNLEDLLRGWVEFIGDQTRPDQDFSSFPINDRPD